MKVINVEKTTALLTLECYSVAIKIKFTTAQN